MKNKAVLQGHWKHECRISTEENSVCAVIQGPRGRFCSFRLHLYSVLLVILPWSAFRAALWPLTNQVNRSERPARLIFALLFADACAGEKKLSDEQLIIRRLESSCLW